MSLRVVTDTEADVLDLVHGFTILCDRMRQLDIRTDLADQLELDARLWGSLQLAAIGALK